MADPTSPEAIAQALIGTGQTIAPATEQPWQQSYQNAVGGIGQPLVDTAKAPFKDLGDAYRYATGKMDPSEEPGFAANAAMDWGSALLPGLKGAGAVGAALHLVPRLNLGSSVNRSLEDVGAQAFRRLIGGQRSYDILDDAKNFKGNMSVLGGSLHPDDSGGYYTDSGEYYSPGKVYVGSLYGTGPNTLGPKETLSLIQELKREYPDMEMLGGTRVTGARGAAGGWGGETWTKIPGTVKPATLIDAKPTLDKPLSDSEHDAMRAFEDEMPQRGSVQNHIRDSNGKVIHLYGENYNHLGTIPTSK